MRPLPALVVLASVISPTSLAAQRLAALPAFPTLSAPVVVAPARWAPAQAPPAREKVGDHRVEGMIALGLVGAFVGGLVGGRVFEGGECSSAPQGSFVPETTVDCGSDAPLFAVVGGLLGGAVGYILGRNTPRWGDAPSSAEPQSGRPRASGVVPPPHFGPARTLVPSSGGYSFYGASTIRARSM